MRRALVAAPAVVVATAAALAGAVSLAIAEPTPSQRFFADRLLAHPDVADRVKDLLRSGGGFVDRRTTFRDLTGDGKDDAVVRVQSGGAAGAIAVYVLSTDTKEQSTELQPVFRSEKLVRASAAISDTGAVTYRYARYSPGDELCCPARVGETTLRWVPAEKRFRVSARRVMPGPEPSQPL